jgi:fibronectin type 3 domain-containing protein
MRPFVPVLIRSLLVFLLAWSVTATAVDYPPGFSETEIHRPDGAAIWNEAVGMQFQSNGRLWVWERGGRVWIVDEAQPVTTPVLNISDEVGAWTDHGMLGFALHPDFAVTGYIYLLYVVDRHHLVNCDSPRVGPVTCGPGYNPNTDDFNSATIGRLVRYKAVLPAGQTDYSNAVAIDPASRRTLLGDTSRSQPKSTGCPITHSSHGVGSLVFGMDGTLLLSCGDGASFNVVDSGSAPDTAFNQALADGIIRTAENVGAFRSQMIDSHAGKILRIDPETGDGIASNPFYDASAPRAPRSKVWTLGIRNGFRFTVRPLSGSHNPAEGNPGAIYLGDVGWNTYEEVNVIRTGGENLGWPLYEGLTSHAGYTATGAVNRDAPNPLFGTGGCSIQFFRFTDLLKQDTLNTPSWPNPCNASQQITSTDVFLHSRAALEYSHGNTTARWAAYDAAGNAVAQDTNSPAPNGANVIAPPFTGSSSQGGVWYTGDDFPATYKNTYFHADYSGQWIRNFLFDSNNVLHEVRDFMSGGGGVVETATNPVTGNLYYNAWTAFVRKISYSPTGNVPPIAVATATPVFGASPLLVNFNASGSHDPNNQALTYQWDFGDGGTSTAANPSHTYNAPAGVVTNFDATVTVRDPGGLTAQKSLLISVNNTPPSVTLTSPVDGSQYPMNSGNQLVPMTASISDAQTPTGNLSCQWLVSLHHNTHEHVEPVVNSCTTNYTLAPVGCDGETYFYSFTLTVTDEDGLQTVREARMYPECTTGPTDTLPPTVPQNLTGQAQGAGQVNLSWSGSTDNGGGLVAGYRIFRNGLALTTTTNTSYTDNTVAGGTTYTYRVSAFDNASPANESAQSNQVSVTTAVDTQAPTVPQNLTGQAVGSSQVNLSWSASTDNGGGTVAGYRIFRNGTSLTTTTGTSYTDNTVAASTTYTYRVAAFDNASPVNESAQSNQVSVTTGAAPTTVIRVNAGGPQYTDSASQVWAADTGFNTGSSSSTGNAIAGTSDPALYQTERWDTGTAPELTYSFTVPNGAYTVKLHFAEIWSGGQSVGARIFDVLLENQLVLDNLDIFAEVGGYTALIKTFQTTVADGQLNISFAHGAADDPEITAIEILSNSGPPPVDTQPPTVPQNLTGQAQGTSQVNLSWSASTDIGGGTVAGYRIFRNGVSLTTTTGTSYSDTTVVASTTYTYRVAAFDNASPANESAQSNQVSVTTPAVPDTQAPTVPQNLTGSAPASSQVQLSWTASTDNGGGTVAGYRIFRNGTSLTTTTGVSYTDNTVAANTTYTYRVAAFDNASPANESAQSNQVSVTTPAPPAIVIRVNAGGPQYTDSASQVWAADTGFNTGSTSSVGNAIAGTSDPALYRTERWDAATAPEMAYSFTVPNGAYTVRLHFAEIWSGGQAVGRRIFDVLLENQLALDNLDIFAEVGGYTALIKTLQTTVSDGQLNINFVHGAADSPKISAIEILSSSGPPPVDTQPPTVPQNLTGQAQGATQVNLSWSASTDNGGGTVAGYRIFRNGVSLTTTTGISYSDTTVVANTSYTYRVAAFDNASPANESAQSNQVSVTTGAAPDTQAPTVPQNLTGQLQGATQVNLSWSASTDNGGGTVAGYRIFRNGTSLTTTTSTSYTDNAVAQNTTYTYRVAAFDNATPANESAQSNQVSVTTGTAPDTQAPTVPQNLTGQAQGTTQVNLSWNASTDNGGGTVAGYRIFRNGTSLTTTTGTSFSDTTVVASTTYTYRVAAFDNASPANESAQSNQVSVTTGAPPDTQAPTVPQNLTGQAVSSSQVTLNWSASTDTGGGTVAGYRIFRNGTSLTTTTAVSYTDNTVAANTAYTYRVAAFDNASPANESAQSNQVSVTTPVPPATVIRVNTGGPQYTDSAAQVWAADTGFNTGSPSSVSNAIAGTSDPALYRTERWDAATAPEMAYSFTVPNGTYTVRLHFAEIWSGGQAVGRRMFNVALEGSQVLSNFDIFAQAGGYTALIRTFQTTVADGQLNINFTHGSADNPTISAIEILSSSGPPPPPDTQAPTVPQNLTGQAPNASQVTLSWAASTDNGGGTVAGYRVFRNGTSLTTTTGTSFTDNAVAASTTYTYRVAAFDNASPANESAQSNQVSVTTPAPSATVIRVNAGGPQYTDTAGQVWAADFGFNTGSPSSTGNAIAGTSDPALYRTERWDSGTAPELAYTFTVPNGSYTVKLHFAEIWDGGQAVGARIFDVLLENQLVLDNLDIFAEVGGYTATIKTFQTTVADGQLNINFLHGSVDDPKISAIEILSN